MQQFQQALSLAQQLNSPALEAQILRNIVRAHLAEGKLDVAERVADEAMAAARRAGGSEEPAMLSAAAQLEFQRGRLASALELINQSFAGVDLTKTAMPMREPHATAHRIHRAVGNAPEALAHLEALKRLDDESTKLATQTSTALMGARFDFANQELRIARLKADELRRTVQHEQDRARTERTIFGVVAAAGSILVGVLVWGLVTARRSRNEVQAARDDLAVTNSALGEALAAKTEFLATTSHEIRTPLNGIMGMTEVMLVDQDLPDGARERLRLVHGAGKTMKALIDDILDVAKIEGGKMSLESAPFDLGEVLRDATLLWEGQIRAQGVEFDVDIDLPPGRVLGDSARLRQIVFNLLSNAAKFTESGAIAFNAAPDDDGNFRIQVRDTGVGIPEDKLEQVFESFRQADASVTRRFGGTGLGLSISRSLARTMGGELAVASRVGEGSVFTLTVPLASHADEPVAPAAEADTVLIVDRNPVMRAMLRNLVSPHADRVVAVGAIDEALAAIAAHAPGAVLVDENMAADDPELRILASARRCGAATLLLRSSGPDGAAPVGVEGVHVVAKPVTGSALIATMFSARVHQSSTEALVSRAA